MKNKIFIIIYFSFFMSASIYASTYAPWLTQIGLTDQVMFDSKGGEGQILGVVDSGISPTSSAFYNGQILTNLSSFAGVSFRPSDGFRDDEGHGTAVAEIAAGHTLLPFKAKRGGYITEANSIIGVAPDAQIIAEKVLNNKGYGYSSDIANGIKKAADAGASVINVSISYDNDQDTIFAINYAASKNVFLVWAGGNEHTALINGQNTKGLTDTAINHLIFAGSVDASNKLSYFSNTPGTGALINTDGIKTPYASRWAMAPGENILAHDIARNPDAYYSWTGTSMSTPIISGSLLLLENAWPILKTNGTAANLLLETATSLGKSSVYGHGLINLTNALNQPNGVLSLKLANGSSVALSTLTSSTVLGGALGAQPAMRAKLASYTTFDSYARDFTVDLSGLLTTKQKLFSEKLNTGVINTSTLYTMQTDLAGNTTTWGYGLPVQFSYAKALYANDDWAALSSELGVSNLASLAQGDGLAVYGRNINPVTRLALSWSNANQASSSNINIGLAHQINNIALLGLNYSLLSENNGLLGSTYNTDSLLNFGANNTSNHVGLSALFNFLPSSKLLLEAALSQTNSATAKGLLAGISPIQSNSLGIGIMQNALFKDNDSLVISLKQPLRIASGQVGILVPSLDTQGLPIFNTEYVSLAPTGREIDYKISYDRPLNKILSLSLQAVYYKDLANIKGKNDINMGVLLKSYF